eukprot:CAMPEP_0196999662 /NCGR_PEP_ID=MMETSP1380-20130617/4786_1 /TAXON_ID=5936 /ORGANISM="Euplotes crassus, Strain CT5" /LENGTH=246 /DNA_ID=CAMNT_0042416653 /DNA_START=796 /DNA_END=1536 /DNA_ORIENTATION=+
MGDDSLVYYSSVGDFTEQNKSKEHELDYEKLYDEGTIFKQIQNYTKNVLLKKTFEGLNNNLRKQNFDYQYSGTTANMIIISGKVLTCANVGDSRCIMATIESSHTESRKNGKDNSIISENTDHSDWKCIVLSRDHKPEFESERKRILGFGGRVEALFDTETHKQLGPYRVWLKDQNVPGLAMSRSLGDEVARKAGVVSDPEIREIELEHQDKFIVQGSDGIWEFMSNKEVIDIVIPYWKDNDPTTA